MFRLKLNKKGLQIIEATCVALGHEDLLLPRSEYDQEMGIISDTWINPPEVRWRRKKPTATDLPFSIDFDNREGCVYFQIGLSLVGVNSMGWFTAFASSADSSACREKGEIPYSFLISPFFMWRHMEFYEERFIDVLLKVSGEDLSSYWKWFLSIFKILRGRRGLLGHSCLEEEEKIFRIFRNIRAIKSSLDQEKGLLSK